jgi:alpha/beta superfamily hydrolase
MESHLIFVKLSRYLEKMGIASVRFDFAGSGESDGDFVDMTISGELSDAHNILDFVKTLDFIDSDRIGLVGMSMGGAIASMLAGQRNSEIKSLCLWAPAGTMADTISERYVGERLPEMTEKGWLDIGGIALGLNFLKDLSNIDIYQRAAGFNKNVFIIHGELDQTVPIKTSEMYLAIYGYRAKLHIIKGGDHLFSSLRIEAEAIEKTAKFLKTELFS